MCQHLAVESAQGWGTSLTNNNVPLEQGRGGGGERGWWGNLEPRREAMRGKSLSGRSMVLATPITANLLPFLIGHSNKLYSTCKRQYKLAATD